MKYAEMNQDELKAELEKQNALYAAYKAKNFSYDMTRGKPAENRIVSAVYPAITHLRG